MTYGTLSGNAGNLQMTGAWANSRYTFAFDTSVSPNVVLNVGGSPPASLTLVRRRGRQPVGPENLDQLEQQHGEVLQC